MRCFLAIDSGGTKCEALAFSSDGNILGRGRCDGSEIGGRNVSGNGRSPECVLAASKRALGSISYDELITGGSISCEGLSGAIRFVYVPEHEASFALMGRETGIVALAGTGALAYGRTQDGRECVLDGLGPILGDCGSSYQVGLMALRAAAKSHWHARHQTSLEEAIRRECCKSAKNNFIEELVEFSLSDLDRSQVAALARLVDEEARNGDHISIRILTQAAHDLAETVCDAIDRLDMGSADIPMIGTGGLIVNSRIYWEALCARIREFAPGIQPMISDQPPVVGVGIAILAKLGEPSSGQAIENLRTFRA